MTNALTTFAATLSIILVTEAAKAAHRRRDADETAPLSPEWKRAHAQASTLYTQAGALQHDAYDAKIFPRPYWADSRRGRVFDPAALAAAL